MAEVNAKELLARAAARREAGRLRGAARSKLMQARKAERAAKLEELSLVLCHALELVESLVK